jgi:hypothetical protein
MNILAAIKREEKKLEKQLSKLQAPTERCPFRRKSTGTFSRRRSEGREEACSVGCGKSRDL